MSRDRDASRTGSPAGGAAGGSLWGARFEGGMAPEMVPLNLSLGIDGRLWREDVAASKAWARALAGAGVLTEAERDTLVEGLDAVVERIHADGLADAPEEDIHSVVERMLGEAVGPVAGKLHTGRSRNDQSSTGVRLWGMMAADCIVAELATLGRALHGLAGRGVDVVMPGYTHLQQAQPIRAAQWALSHLFALLRDAERVRHARAAASVLPLGSGAIAGCPFPVDREALRAELGFERVSENSLDAVSDRDWVCDFTYAGAMIGVHLSRLGEDLVLFSSVEYGFVRIADGYSTGSSLMPQKRNPDVAELARGKSGRLVGNLTAMLTLLKGLPTGYNRDLQEDKEVLFDTMDTLLLTLPPVSGAVRTASFRPERARAAMDPQLLATDLADYLVRRGVPFRTSHEVIGRLVRLAEERGAKLSELALEDFRAEHEAFGSDVHDVFDWEASTDARDTPGGTSRRSIERQLEDAGGRLDELEA
ncbi:MAG TPA: argininosuccinate lyase [Longimicrobiales bacterium]|nr:argininosuccinate lyase [Longimicrobiales bacterium]